MSSAAKRADRIAAEGAAHTLIDGKTAGLMELKCERDFVTKNDQFKELLDELAKHLLTQKPADLEEAMAQPLHGSGDTVETHINKAVSTIGEKITLRRFVILEKTDDDVFGAYIHLGGTIGALTVVEGTDDEEFAKDIAMHIAAASPQFVSREDVDKDLVDQERDRKSTRLNSSHVAIS